LEFLIDEITSGSDKKIDTVHQRDGGEDDRAQRKRNGFFRQPHALRGMSELAITAVVFSELSRLAAPD
jgi:hypothetical protein